MILRRGALALSLSLCASACYRGEWRTGAEVPLQAQGRLLPTRDVERWEIEPTSTSYVVRVKGDIAPRCRVAQFGSTRRTDTGTFERTGGNYWRATAMATGILGGAAALTGMSGWVSQPEVGGPYARPAMYAVGGLLAVGGIVNCILSIQKGTRARYALCGSLLGSGVMIGLGAGLSQIPTTREDMLGMPVQQPLIGVDVFKGLVYGGAALVGVAAAAGVASAVWKGGVERTRVIEQPRASLWDRRQAEQHCGPARPLVGRTATLEISAERVPEGAGSEGEPLKMRVALGEEGKVAVDLRALRQALPECGVLRVQLNPDTLYEQFSEDYVPPGAPEAGQGLGRPIHGQVLPREGLTLQALEGRAARGQRVRGGVSGFPDDVLAAMGKRCRAELARGGRYDGRPASQGFAPAEREPGEEMGPPAPPLPAAPAEGAGAGAGDDGPCSPEKRQALVRDCEHSCGKSLEISACLFDRRKCQIDARYSQQRGRDQELCELNWEKCLFKAGVGPGAWGRCVEGCQKKNEVLMCREGE
jgi:hypothetical protein